MTLRYRVLGPTRALCPDGSEVPLGGARLRALLAALAAGAGRAVPVPELAARVWGDDDTAPADTAAAVQALVGRLRRALGRDAVESAPGGYRLAADPDDVDVFRFERLARQGADALADGDAQRAARLLDEALALWRGPVLADLPLRERDPLVVRAERRHAEARRARLAAETALGRAEHTLPELAALVAATPLDEPLRVLHIRALTAAGRRAEALVAYESARVALDDALGTAPGPELRALHAELLRNDPSVDPAARAASARHAESATRPGNLRARLTSFVGREPELLALRADLADGRLVTLTGPGGAGKTRLALEAAEAVAQEWADGVWLAELAPVREAAQLPQALLTALGARESVLLTAAEAGPRDPLERLVAHCGHRRMLLVLDNCEQIAAGAAELAHELLTGCPGVTVLATSREPLGVPGERVRGVGPLPLDTALRLFGERGAAARAGFSVSDDPEAAAEVCRRLDGLPLALELAAARLRMLTPRQLADRLDDRFRLLGDGARTSRTLRPRQQTLRAVVDWSWELLDARERALLRRLAVFSGGFALPEAEAVCADPADPAHPADVLGLLASLVDKSLVVAAPDGGAMRYRLLETVAEYAAERLAESGERTAVELRHLVAYRELARTGEAVLRGPRQADGMRRFETEHGNVRTALGRAVEHGREQDALCLTLSMSWFWQLRGHQSDARAWSLAATGMGPDPFAEPVRRAVPLTARCTDAPPPWSEEQLWEARRGVRMTLFAGGGDGEGAEFANPATGPYLRRIVAAYGSAMPQNCRQPGSVWYFARMLTREFAGFPQAVDAMVEDCRAHGEPWDLAFALLLRAKLVGGPDADEALALFERLGDPWAIAETLSARGEDHSRQGRYEEAAADFERAMESTTWTGAYAQGPMFKARLATVRLAVARTDEESGRAERLLLDAVEESRHYAGEGVGTARMLLAHHYAATGRVALAREQLRLMEAEFIKNVPEMFRGLVAGVDGWLDCLGGAYADALGRVREAVRRLEAQAYLVAPNLITSQFLVAAWAKAHLGAAEEGARLLGAYDRHADGRHGGFGLRPLPSEPAVRRRAEAELRAVLDDTAYRRSYEEGHGLAVEEAAALV
ncbi:BTAD domain-containing putative transcriptional regulator [Streptomyces sp. BPTC-684]|uniref:ATP-binding protein n=1 Tax=Streptomyces sp. BPTC-684 TaxID=3043734 RepID=UPI0024B08942|nr:BTAD domain-containing putative transcriptional regulator [Streptomyces sp. BPTC-684]WHM35603.1 BTAD domain-containing putative transcriptional regulator [Streptomyces sp. BPTC-684]